MLPTDGCPTCRGLFGIAATVPLADAPTELLEAEALDRQIRDLMAVLRTSLSPAQLRLVWTLHDAAERLGIAEALLREQRLKHVLERHRLVAAPAARDTLNHVLAVASIENELTSSNPHGLESPDETP